MKIFNYMFDFISSKKCYSCKKEWHFLCDICYKKEYDFKSVCYVCKWTTKKYIIHPECKKEVFYDKLIILKHYNSQLVKKTIKQAKFYWKKYFLYIYSKYLYEKFLLNQKIGFKKEYLIIPVPSHFIRKFKRWYNSSEILCKYFSKISWIKYNKNIVKKIKNTRQQSKLNKEQRLINIKNSFKINKKKLDKIDKKIIIIIDDVVSTWTTVNELSKILRESGVKNIIVLIIASD